VLTKPDLLYGNLDIQKIEHTPQLTDNTLPICTPRHIHLNPNNTANQPKNHPTKIQLDEATSQLCNIEKQYTTEKTINIDLNLYQMEEY
jgi:hypothetical protein